MKELQVQDVLILFLKKFRPIFFLALCFAIVFGALGAWKGYQTLTDPVALEAQEGAYLVKRGEFESSVRQLRTELERAQKRQKELKEYSEQSIYYNLDSTNEAVSELVFYVDTGYQIVPNQFYQNPDKTSDIVNAYCEAYRSPELYQALSVMMGKAVEEKYLDELITVERAGDTKIKDSLGNVSIRHSDGNNAVLIIRARAEKEEVAAKMTEFTFDYLQTKVAANVAAHTANVLSHSSRSIIDQDLQQLQLDTQKEQEELATKLITKQAEFTQKERSAPAKPSFSKITLLKKAILYALAGGMIGGVIACVVLLLVDLSDHHLGDAGEVRRRYQGMLLGVFQKEAKQNKNPLFFHRLIDRLEGGGENSLTVPQTAAYITASLATLTSSAQKQTFLLTGTAEPTVLAEFGKQLQESASGELSYLLGENMLESADTISLLQKADAVVLLEQSGYSLLPRIEEEIQRTAALGKKVSGIILVS